MKTKLSFILLFLSILPVLSQNSKYEYKGRFGPSVKEEVLQQAHSLAHIMPGFDRFVALPTKERLHMDQVMRIMDSLQGYSFYPRGNYNEVIDLVSAEILARCNGKYMAARSTGDALTAEQKSILKAADLFTDIKIILRFKYKDWANEAGEVAPIKEGEYRFTVVPSIEAGFPGGNRGITDYLRKTVFDKLNGPGAFDKVQQAIVKFTVNEEGRVIDAKMSRDSSDAKTDRLILDAIQGMPLWKPAVNSKGIKVKQEFTIPFGAGC